MRRRMLMPTACLRQRMANLGVLHEREATIFWAQLLPCGQYAAAARLSALPIRRLTPLLANANTRRLLTAENSASPKKFSPTMQKRVMV